MFRRKSWIAVIALLLSAVFMITACASNNAQTVESPSVINIDEYSESKLQEYFDDVIYGENRITAYQIFEKEAMTGYADVALIETENIRTAYDVEYSPSEDIVYVSISTFDENDSLIDASVATAYPIRYDNGIDASLEIEGNTILLSELLGDGRENCFLGAAIFGIFSVAKIIAAVVAAAKVVAVVTGVLAIGAVTYKVASLTAEKIEAREREAEIEARRKKDNPKYYYPAQLKDDKLLIAANPHYLRQAVGNVVKGTSYWTPQDFMAKALAIEASGGYVGPEIDKSGGKPKEGYYYHYHLFNRKAGSHIFFGGAYGGVY